MLERIQKAISSLFGREEEWIEEMEIEIEIVETDDDTSEFEPFTCRKCGKGINNFGAFVSECE